MSGLGLLAGTAAMLMIVHTQQAAAKADPGCAAGGVTIQSGASPASVTINDTTTSSGLSVVVTITGTTFAITPADSDVTLTGATWCLKASTKTQNGTGTAGTSNIKNAKGVPQRIGYVVVYGVASQAANCSGVSGVNQNGQVTLTFTIQEDSGLDRLEVIDIANSTYSISGFFPGTTDPVTLVATKINQAAHSGITFDLYDGDGNKTTCDSQF